MSNWAWTLLVWVAIYATALTISFCVFNCEDAMTVQSGFAKTYTTTVTRAVGPTTLSNARGTLPQPTPTDINAVFVAPNGSDAGANGAASTGILAAPVLTLAKALQVMAAQPTRSTSVIVRNGYVGELLFNITTSLAFTTFNLQATKGEYAIVRAVSGGPMTVSVTTGKINGIYFEGTASTSSLISVCVNGIAGQIQNCMADLATGCSLGSQLPAATEMNFYYCVGRMLFTSLPATGSINIVNCLIQPQLVTATSNSAIKLATTAAAGTVTINVTRSVIWGPNLYGNTTFVGTDARYGVIGINDSNAGSHTYTFNFTSSWIAWSVEHLFECVSSASATDDIVNANFNYCQLGGVPTLSAPVDTVTFTSTEINPLPSSLPGMFVNFPAATTVPTGGVNVDAEGIRLQIEGKTVPGTSSKYSIDSPLHNAGSGGLDVAPWDETTVLSSIGYATEYTFDYPPKSFKMQPEPVNPTAIVDTRGNKHNYNDGTKRRLIFTWGDTQAMPPDDIRKLADLLGARGTIRIYPGPNGTDHNLWTGDETTANGSLSSGLGLPYGTAIFQPDAPDPLMIERNWQGFQLELIDGLNTYIYYIESNDTIQFNLIDKLGQGYPADADFPFAIRFILATAEQNPVEFNQQDYTQFLRGGRWRETNQSIESNTYAYTTTTFEAFEAEDDEEGV